MCPACGYVQYRNPTAVVAAILLSDGSQLPPPGKLITLQAATHLLLVRRSAPPRGSWCIPCGYIEYEEDIREAAEREMREETGLVTRAEGVFAVHSNFHDPANHTVGTWFLARYISGTLEPGDDADQAACFPISSPPEPLAFPTDREVMRRLVADVLRLRDRGESA
jgi:ADP-ribose pyrophosphatase YjhB (NUDIX family)